MSSKPTPSVDYKKLPPQVECAINQLKARPVILEVFNLCKEFAADSGTRKILDNVSFQVHQREFLSVIGPSGCGKSTLARIIAGLEQATSGMILLDTYPVNRPGPERGMVFQKYTLFPWMTVKQNIMFGLELNGLGDSAAEAEARQWLDIVGLELVANQFPAQLSGGMQQRVAIARALATRPRLLLMDEPFGALDAQTRAKMQAYLLEICRNIDITVIFITHDLDEAIYLSDRILALKANPGEIKELIEVPVPRPRSPEQFLSAEFLATKMRLEELIHAPQKNSEDDNIKVLNMVAQDNRLAGF